MGKLFEGKDPNPEETGWMALYVEAGTESGILLSAWDRETAVKIMDDLTMTTDEEMPNFWEIRGPEDFGEEVAR